MPDQTTHSKASRDELTSTGSSISTGLGETSIPPLIPDTDIVPTPARQHSPEKPLSENMPAPKPAPSSEDNTAPNDSPDSMIEDRGKEAVYETPSRKPSNRKGGKSRNYPEYDVTLEGAKPKR